MTTEGNYTQRDLDAAFSEGWRAGAPRAKAGAGIGKTIRRAFTLIIVTIITGIIVAQFLGYSPARLTTSATQQEATAPPAPTSPPRATVGPWPTPIIITLFVPQGQAAQTLSIPVPTTPPAGAPAAPAVPKPVVIVLHEGYQQPVITGSGACQAAKGARRCGK